MFAFEVPPGLRKLAGDVFGSSTSNGQTPQPPAPAIPPLPAAATPAAHPTTAVAPSADAAHPADAAHLTAAVAPSAVAAHPGAAPVAAGADPDAAALLQRFVDLFGGFGAPAEPVAKTPPAPGSPEWLADPNAIMAEGFLITEMARVAALADQGGKGHEAVLANLDPFTRKEVEDKIVSDRAAEAKKAHDAQLAQQQEAAHKQNVANLIACGHTDFDVKKVTKELEELTDPAERQRVLDDYKKVTRVDLADTLKDELGEDNHFYNATKQLLSPARTAAEQQIAAFTPEQRADEIKKARAAAFTIGNELLLSKPDKRKIFDTLGFRDNAYETELIRQQFLDIYPELGGMFNMLNSKLDGDDEREAIADLEMGGDRRKLQAAAGMKNAFTGFGHDNDRARMKDMLHKLTPGEIADMKKYPGSYHDILDDVDDTMHGMDKAVVDAYVAGDHDKAEGLQLTEDVVGNPSHLKNSEDCDRLDDKALLAKLRGMTPDERAAAVKGIAAMNAPGATGDELLTPEALMTLRFKDDNTPYDKDQAIALLKNDEAGARAARAEEAIVHSGTNVEELEGALTDPDLDPKLAQSKDPAERAKHDAAKLLHEQVLARVKAYGHGGLQEQVDGEKKEQMGSTNRAAFTDLMCTGTVGFGVKMKRAIDDGKTDDAKALMFNASKDDIAEARAQFPYLDAGEGFDYAVKMAWGPTKDATGMHGLGALAGGPTVETVDPDGDKSGTFIKMEEVLNRGEGAVNWDPKTQAMIDRKVFDADRSAPSMDEMTGKSLAGLHYAYSVNAEQKAAADGVTGEEFAFKAEVTDKASGSYLQQKTAETEDFISHLKLAVTLVTMIALPEFAPLILPLMSGLTLAYEEKTLGKNFKGEREAEANFGIDVALAVIPFLGEGAIEARTAAKVASGIKDFEEAKQAATALRLAEAGKSDASAVVAGVKGANAAADEAQGAIKIAAASKDEAQLAADAAEKLRLEASAGKVVPNAADQLEANAKVALDKLKLDAEAAAKSSRLAMELATNATDTVLRDEVQGKSFADIAKDVTLGGLGMAATKIAESIIGPMLGKHDEHVAAGGEGEAPGAAGAAAAPHKPPEHESATAPHKPPEHETATAPHKPPEHETATAPHKPPEHETATAPPKPPEHESATAPPKPPEHESATAPPKPPEPETATAPPKPPEHESATALHKPGDPASAVSLPPATALDSGHWYQTPVGKYAVLLAAKTLAGLPFIGAANDWDPSALMENLAKDAAAGAHSAIDEHNTEKAADKQVEEEIEKVKHDEEDRKNAEELKALAPKPKEPEPATTDPFIESSLVAANERAKIRAQVDAMPISADEKEQVADLMLMKQQQAVGDGLRAEAAALREQHGGVLSVDDARALQERGKAQGLTLADMPRASSPEEVLIARGMTPEEMQLYKEAMLHDAQSHIGDAGVRDLSKEQGRTYGDDHDENITGVKREPLNAAQVAAVLKANELLYQDVKAGELMVKVIPEAAVGGLMLGRTNFGIPKASGDWGHSQNTEGMTPEEKVQYLALDYQGSGYVQGEGASKEVKPEVAKVIYQIEERMTPEQAAAAKPVVGVDVYDFALGEAIRYQQAKASDPTVEIPRIYELDPAGDLAHFAPPRVRDNAESPSTGMGATASMGMRDENGDPYFRPNQELLMTTPQNFKQGAELVSLDAKGDRKVLATYDEREMRFKMAAGLSETEVQAFTAMMDAQHQRNEKNDQDWTGVDKDAKTAADAQAKKEFEISG